MRRFYLLILFVFFCVNVNSQDLWLRKTDFKGASRYGAVCFTIGSKIYYGLGASYDPGTQQTTYYSDFWEYDPLTNNWVQKASYPSDPISSYSGARSAIAFSINGKGYVGTGACSNPNPLLAIRNDFYQYDPLLNQWNRKADFAGKTRWAAVSFSIGNKGYIGMGGKSISNGIEYYNDLWEYDPNYNSWSMMKNLPSNGRWRAVAFSIGSKGYVGTGDAGNQTGLKDFWEYNPTNDSWMKKADLPDTARHAAIGFALKGKGYIGSGTEVAFGGVQFVDFWEYNPLNNTWTKRVNVPSVSFQGGASATSDKGYGVMSNAVDFWEYTPVDNVSIEKNTGNDSYFSILPNPNNGSFKLKYKLQQNHAFIAIYNVLGEILYLKNLPILNNSLEISEFNFSNGTYYYKVVNGDSILFNGQIIVLR